MQVASRFQRVKPSSIRTILNRAQDLESQGHRVFHFEIGRPNFDTPEPVKQATSDALARGEVHYGPNAGLPPLRRAIAQHLSETRNITLAPEQIVLTVGGIEAVYISLLTVINPGDEVLILQPCWSYYVDMVQLMDGVPVAVASAPGFQIDVDAIKHAITPRTRAVIVNSPNNPTGSTYDDASLSELAQIAVDHDLLVVSDEIYDRILFRGLPHRSIASLPGMAERTAIVGAFSKTYSMTGWRMGYTALPRTLQAAGTLSHVYINTSINTFIQYGGITALSSPVVEAEVEAMCQEYERRHDEALARLQAMPGVECQPSDGTFYLFPRFSNYPDDWTLASRLLEEIHLATVPGSAFGLGGEGRLRFSISCDWDTLTDGLDALANWLRQNQ